jgi:hypothetical protein
MLTEWNDSRERELRSLATACRRQATGATTFGAAAALVTMADTYERRADRLRETTIPKR